MRRHPHARTTATKKPYEQTDRLGRVQENANHGSYQQYVEPKAAPTEFLTGPDVQARYRKSHVTIWRWVKDADLEFPAPIQINRLNYWRLSDLEAWEMVQAAA